MALKNSMIDRREWRQKKKTPHKPKVCGMVKRKSTMQQTKALMGLISRWHHNSLMLMLQVAEGPATWHREVHVLRNTCGFVYSIQFICIGSFREICMFTYCSSPNEQVFHSESTWGTINGLRSKPNLFCVTIESEIIKCTSVYPKGAKWCSVSTAQSFDSSSSSQIQVYSIPVRLSSEKD